MKVRKREQDELEKEKLSELQLRKEAEELAKNEARQMVSLASEFCQEGCSEGSW